MEQIHQVLLYYCFTPLDDPETFREQHHEFCLSLGLVGRIIISSEGLNGTISGTPEACATYMEVVKSDPRFAQIDFKIDHSSQPAFTKLHVRTKDEIVHSDLFHIKPWERTGAYLEPKEMQEILKDTPEDTVILDCRSNYEHEIGKFKGAVTLDIENFRELPDQIEKLQAYKNKKVITYCTGGIKCEKASAYLLEQGFENVYQLHGGIIKYGLETGGENFEGKCYVFDNRIHVDVNKINPSVIAKCHVCGTATDRMVNCANAVCNEHFPLCDDCGWKMEGCCSPICMENPNKRAYNGTGYYQKNTIGYNPKIGLYRKPKEMLQESAQESTQYQNNLPS